MIYECINELTYIEHTNLSAATQGKVYTVDFCSSNRYPYTFIDNNYKPHSLSNTYLQHHFKEITFKDALITLTCTKLCYMYDLLFELNNTYTFKVSLENEYYYFDLNYSYHVYKGTINKYFTKNNIGKIKIKRRDMLNLRIDI